MYVTTQAVETFVEEHYTSQIVQLENELRQKRLPEVGCGELLAMLRAACADEVAHKEDAARLLKSDAGLVDSMQYFLVYWGSRVGAALAKRL